VGVVAILAALGLARRDELRENWLNGQPTEQLRQMVDHAGADPLLHYIYARRLVDEGSVHDAVQPIGRAIQFLTPDSPPALIGQVFALAGFVTVQQGSDRVGAENLRRAAVINANDVFLHMGKGVLALHKDDAITAVAEAELAVKLSPKLAAAWELLGKAYTGGGELDQALAAYNRAVALAPRVPAYHADLALALGNVHQYSDAEAQYEQARSLAPGDPAFTYLPAIAQTEAARTDDDYRKTASQLETIIAAQPQDYQMLRILAGLNIRFGHFKDARKELETSVAASPQSDVAWFNLSVVCDRLGDHAAAASALKRSRRIDDDFIATAERKRALILAGGDVDTSPPPVWEAHERTGAEADGENHL
jgi:tetratricopeptide (TPR) repeat protein